MSMMMSKACDVTGIAAIACARHGCFAPNSVANLFRGEQQKNVDWAFLQALKTTNIDIRQGAMLIYDIACQYIIHLHDRIGHLLPPGLDIDSAIGLFHVHGHKDICFFRYATSFIPGAGVVAGEILESLWAVLNAVTPAMRTATLAHRSEIMDDHMTDSNHKKSIAMADTLTTRYVEATQMARSANQYYHDLVQGIDSKDIAGWEAEITYSENNRSHDKSLMDIIGARRSPSGTTPAPMPSPMPRPLTDWIHLAIDIEEKQYVILLFINETINKLSSELKSKTVFGSWPLSPPMRRR
jgi:hypothetical protein